LPWFITVIVIIVLPLIVLLLILVIVIVIVRERWARDKRLQRVSRLPPTFTCLPIKEVVRSLIFLFIIGFGVSPFVIPFE
jgi:hypothetical protein